MKTWLVYIPTFLARCTQSKQRLRDYLLQCRSRRSYSSVRLFLLHSFELNYDPVPLRDWMVDNPWLPIVAITLYAVGIIYGRNRFKNQPAWDWRGTMAIWNLLLSTFSAIGFVRTLPQLIHNYTNYTVTENLCFDPESTFGSGATGFWVQIFCLSKMPYVYYLDQCFWASRTSWRELLTICVRQFSPLDH